MRHAPENRAARFGGPAVRSARRLLAVAGLACATAFGGGGGCASPRINHFHNEGNAKVADDANDSFEGFAASTAAAATGSVASLQVRQELAKEVSTTRLRVLDRELARTTTDVNWLRLRVRLLADLGMLRNETYADGGQQRFVDADDPRVPDTVLGDIITRYEDQLQERISRRQLRIAAAAELLRATAAARKVLLDQATADVTRAQKERDEWNRKFDVVAAAQAEVDAADSGQPGSGGNKGDKQRKLDTAKDDLKVLATKTAADQAKADADRKEVVDFLQSLFDKLLTAARTTAEDRAVRARATKEQVKLLDDIRNSQDPAGATALAAVVGTGLDDDSFTVLDSYIEHLERTLDDIREDAREVKNPPKGGDSDDEGPVDSWVELLQALERAANLKNVARIASLLEDLVVLDVPTDRPAGAPAGNAARGNAAGEASPRLKARSAYILVQHAPQTENATHAALDQFKEARKSIAEKFEVEYQDLVRRQSSTRELQKTAIPAYAPAQASAPQRNVYTRLAERPPAGTDATAKIARERLASAMLIAQVSTSGNLRITTGQIGSVRRALNISAQALRQLLVNRPLNADPALVRALQTGRAQAKADARAGESLYIGAQLLSDAFVASPAARAKFTAAISAKKEDAAGATSGGGGGGPGGGAGGGTSTTGKAAENKALADAMTQLGSVVSDVLKESLASRLRVSDFLLELARIQADLSSEQIRHTQALLGSAEAEFNRWKLVGDLNADYGEIFANNTEAAQVELQRYLTASLNDLFSAQATLRSAEHEVAQQIVTMQSLASYVARLEDQLAGRVPPDLSVDRLPEELRRARKRFEDARQAVFKAQVAIVEPRARVDRLQLAVDDLRRRIFVPRDANGSFTGDPTTARLFQTPNADLHAKVTPNDGVLVTLRRLAENYRNWRTGAATGDPLGDNVLIANARLFKAVRTIHGHVLIISMNEHLADENVLRLSQELSQHSLSLAALDARVREAGFRLTLGDIRAFHATGINENDIRAAGNLFIGGLLFK